MCRFKLLTFISIFVYNVIYIIMLIIHSKIIQRYKFGVKMCYEYKLYVATNI